MSIFLVDIAKTPSGGKNHRQIARILVEPALTSPRGRDATHARIAAGTPRANNRQTSPGTATRTHKRGSRPSTTLPPRATPCDNPA
jgi:hypothetical protein